MWNLIALKGRIAYGRATPIAACAKIRIRRPRAIAAPFREVDSNRHAFSCLQSTVCLRNGFYLATIRARACSIIDFASFHGQEAARARKTPWRRNVRHSALESPSTSANDERLFEFTFSRPANRSSFGPIRISRSRRNRSCTKDGSPNARTIPRSIPFN